MAVTQVGSRFYDDRGNEMEFRNPEWVIKNPVKPSVSQYDKARLLDTAKETVSGRGKNYGTPEDNFKRIAHHWEFFLVNSKGSDNVQFSITPGDVAIMMALMKIARLENDPKHADSWIDLAGYAACGAEIETA